MATYDATVILPNAAASYKQIADELAWPGFDWLLLARDYDRSLGTWFAARKTRRQPR